MPSASWNTVLVITPNNSYNLKSPSLFAQNTGVCEMDQPESEGLRLLSFNGSDIQAFSQLLILNEFMKRVTFDSKSQNPVLPCDYFHMMAGVGSGGLIVIMLSVLRMEIEETIETFLSIWESVFANKALDREARSAKLEDELRALLQRKGFSEHRKLYAGDQENKYCKVFICAVPEINLRKCEKLKDYAFQDVRPTIIEALRATCASLSLFIPASIKNIGGQASYITAAYTFNNPTWEMIVEACEYYRKDHPVACLLSLGCEQSKSEPNKHVGDINLSDLVEEISWGCQRVDQNLSWRMAELNVYYRMVVGGMGRPNSPLTIEEVRARTECYLEEHSVKTRLDRCVETSMRLGRCTLADIAGFPERRAASSHGLPHLSAFYVERPTLIKKMTKCVFRIGPAAQKILILSGLSGIGKTQVTISFLHQFLPRCVISLAKPLPLTVNTRFSHVLFIDGSSVRNIESGVIGRVKLFGTTYSRSTVAEALDVLANPDQEITREWVIVYDNVDDPSIDISQYFPNCSFGSIIITTCNPNLGNLAPQAHIQLDVMTEEEAVEVLLQSAIGGNPTKDDEAEALLIARDLGYLPVALVQAGYFIKVHRCMHDYRRRLARQSAKMLDRPAQHQRDKHCHAVYQTLNLTWSKISTQTQSFLSLLGFINYTGFPLVLVYRAAARGFCFERFHFCDHIPLFEEAVHLLRDTFRENEDWEEQDVDDIDLELKQHVDDLVAELESYSLVSRIKIFTVMTLRLHPLVHKWIYDRLSKDAQKLYQAAAVRLLVSGTSADDEDIFEFVYPHANFLYDRMDRLHINDQAALATIFAYRGDTTKAVEVWDGVHKKVAADYGDDHLLVTVVDLQRADVYRKSGDASKILIASDLECLAMERRAKVKGFDHPMTIKAFAQMARGVAQEKRPKPVLIVALFFLLTIMGKHGSADAKDALVTKEIWATAIRTFSRNRSIESWTEILRERLIQQNSGAHITTSENAFVNPEMLRATDGLAAAYEDDASDVSDTSDWSMGDNEYTSSEISAIDIWMSLVKSRAKSRGVQHPDTLKAIEGLASAYSYQNMEEESIDQWERVAEIRKTAQGSTHDDTLRSISQLAKVCTRFQRCTQAILHLKDLNSLGEEKWKATTKQGTEELYFASRMMIRAKRGLAILYEELQKEEDAKKVLEDMVTWAEEFTRFGNPKMLYAMEETARLRTRRQEYEDAENLWNKVIVRRKELQGPTHNDTLRAMVKLGESYALGGRFDKAESQWMEVITLSEHEEVASALPMLHAMEALATMLQDCGKYDRSIQWWKTVISSRKKERETYHSREPNAVKPLQHLLATFASRAQSSAEVAFLEDFMKPRHRNWLAPGNRKILAAQHNLAKVYAKCGMIEEEEALLTKAKSLIPGGLYNTNGLDDRIGQLLEHMRLFVAKTLQLDPKASQDIENATQVIERSLGVSISPQNNSQADEDAMIEIAKQESQRIALVREFLEITEEVISMILEFANGDLDVARNHLMEL
ncbi:hypothetical protein M408DRAFT_20617 [Serendipita vermifera MAFF 305830]|uniref:PNPLA domain-containing protein n=1 Tax=Serendipita vermifera MAFF 305830 TaxID=933852 RepID=A0A0C3B633_SERVB|nr:hypothetical protein M408DRAFT_20617 [Serendipita vermifera MAFF 305830]